MNIFECQHPASSLLAITGKVEQTKTTNDFINEQIRLRCLKCGQDVAIKWATFNGGVNKFWEPVRQAQKKLEAA